MPKKFKRISREGKGGDLSGNHTNKPVLGKKRRNEMEDGLILEAKKGKTGHGGAVQEVDGSGSENQHIPSAGLSKEPRRAQ